MPPSLFTGYAVGSPRLPGSTRLLGPRIEIEAGGADIWGVSDEFHFAAASVVGDFELSARIESLHMADLYTKAGLMLRTSLNGDADHAYHLAFGDNQPRNKNNGGLEFQFRQTPGGPSCGIYPSQPLSPQPEFPVTYPHVWLKLIRKGDVITGLHSRDGTTWRTFCVHSQSFPPTLLVGLAVTSHHADQTVRAVFSDVQLTRNS